MATNTDLIQRALDQCSGLEAQFAVLQVRIENLEKVLDRIDTISIAERFKVLETQVSELKRIHEETDKRRWQWVYLFLGGGITLAVSVIVQLLVLAIKK